MELLNNTTIFELEERYSKMLEKCRFAGDIVLPKEELNGICSILKSYTGYIDSNRLNNLLLVIAVNIAYYYYDEEGFWKHFYGLCKFQESVLSTEIVGRKIEQTLLGKNLMSYRRAGPFRYVGAILEQTGITNHNTPAYARLIQEIVRTYRVRNLRNITYQSYKSMVEYSGCSKYLKEYLIDEAGWDFTQYTLKIIYYLENGAINSEDLYGFKGIHPRFWDEFFKYYSMSNTKNLRDKVSLFFRPLLLFDETNSRIYIKLPSTNYKIDKINITSNRGSKLYIYLNSREKLMSRYTGSRITKDGEKLNWDIFGWNPSIEPHAYFHRKYGYIKNIRSLKDGNYYLITNNETNIPAEKIIRHLGNLNLSDTNSFYVFEVNIKNTFNAPTQPANVELNWKHKNNLLSVNSYYDIFINDLPEVVISNADMLEDDEVLLLYDIGNGIRRIRDYNNISELRNEIKSRKAVKGLLWVENMNRTRLDKNYIYDESLKFCVIPTCELQLPTGLYSIRDYVRFKSNSPYINYQDCKRKENGFWIINEGKEILEGKIQADKDEVYFNHTVYRVFMVINEDSDSRYFDYDGLQEYDPVSLYGKPKTRINLVINDGIQMYTLMKNILLNETGEYEFEYRIIKDTLEELNLDSGKFYIELNGTYIDADMGYLNLSNIMSKKFDTDRLKEKTKLIKKINEKVSEKINQIFAITSNGLNNAIYLPANKQTANLDELYKITLIMAQIFDGLVIKDEEGSSIEFVVTDIEDREILNTISWYVNAKEALNRGLFANIVALRESYGSLNWFPETLRWKNKINELYSELEGFSDTKKIFIEWSEETRKQKRFQLKSNIAQRDGGSLLTLAWIDYLKGNYIHSIDKLANIETNEDSIITDLKTLLQATIYIKQTRINALGKLIENSVINSSEVKTILSIYNNTCRIISGEAAEALKDIERCVTFFPFRQEDAEFIIKSNILLQSKMDGNSPKEIINSRNWLVNLVACHLFGDNKIFNEIFIKNIKFIMDTIPESPEKEELLKKIIN